jgi:hypothetical protein
VDSKRNKNAGKHPSYDKLNMSEERRKKKIAYDKKYSASPARKKYRAELNTANRRAGTYGNGDKLDMSHTTTGLKLRTQKSNRKNNGQDGKSTKQK